MPEAPDLDIPMYPTTDVTGDPGDINSPIDRKKGAPIINPHDEGAFIFETPAEVEEWMIANGIHRKKYTVSIRKLPLEGGATGSYMPYVEKNRVPTIDDLGKWYGPGTYEIGISYYVSQPEGKSKLTRKDFTIRLGEEWAEINEAHAAEKLLAHGNKLEALKRKGEIRSAIRGGKNDEKDTSDPIDELRRANSLIRELTIGTNITSAHNNNNGQTEIFQSMLAMQQKSSETMMQMFMAMQNANTQLLTAVLSGQNKPQSNDIFKEVTGLIMQTLDLKNALTPEKKDAADKIIGLIEGVLPALLEIHKQKGMTALQQNELFQAAKDSQKLKDIATDQISLEYLIKTMDAKHGEDQTDIMLKSLGLQRTPNTQRTVYPNGSEDAEIIEPESFEEPGTGAVSESEQGDLPE